MKNSIEYKELEEEVERLLKELDSQLESTITNHSEFHVNLIDIMAKNPESKEIIQFIVSTSDRLETKQELIKDILSDSLKDLVTTKRKILELIFVELETANRRDNLTTKTKKKINSYYGLLKDNPKTLLFIIFSILLLIGFIIAPVKLLALIKLIFTNI